MEELLKKSFATFTLNEIEHYPQKNALDALLPYSEVASHRLRKAAVKIWKQAHRAQTVKKAIAIFVLICCAGIISYQISPELRAAVHYIFEHFSDHEDIKVPIKYNPNATIGNELYPTWIPEDMILTEETYDDAGYQLIYYNEVGDDLIISATLNQGQGSTSIDNERHKNTTEIVGGHECIIMTPLDDSACAAILFHYDYIDYDISSTKYNIETLKKIVENMK